MALKENFVLQPGTPEEAAKYREKIYYFSSPEAKEKFLEQPEEYVAHDEPLKVKTVFLSWQLVLHPCLETCYQSPPFYSIVKSPI